MTKHQVLEQALRLTDPERREVADALFDSLDDATNLPPPLREELDRRYAESKASPGSGMPLDEFRRRLLSRPLPSGEFSPRGQVP